MGKLRKVGIAEQRLYADPTNPETSDYDVTLPITVPEAVIDPETGKTLDKTLDEYGRNVTAASAAAENANTAAQAAKTAAESAANAAEQTAAKATAATITIGEVITGAAGSAAKVENVGTPNAARLNITIPRGDPGINGAKGDTGAAGRGISSVTITYQQTSSSSTSPPTGTWSSSIPSPTAGYYLWTKTVISYTDGTTPTTYYSVSRNGSNGTNGSNATVTVDSSLSSSSSNPVRNSVVYAALQKKMDADNPTGTGSFSMGRKSGTTVGSNSFACGYNVTASLPGSVACGSGTTASGDDEYMSGNTAFGAGTKATGDASFACGGNTAASGDDGSFACGWFTEASGTSSFVCGSYTKASAGYSFACGQYNNHSTSNTHLFTIGYGAYNAPKNVFRVSSEGQVYALKSSILTGADYAEYIKEWHDGNINNEDRRGYFVTVKEGKLRKAEPGDYILGITSGNPSIIGNGDEDWTKRWERDEFNQLIFRDVEVDDYKYLKDEKGNKTPVKIGSHIERQTVQVPNYDPTQKYIERKDRPEWSAVGMLGVIRLRDDGTCVAGGFAKCSKGGIGTRADEWECHKTFFVIERINDHIVSVEMR